MRKRRWRRPVWTGRGQLVRQGDVAIRLTAFACVGEAPMAHLVRRGPSASTYSSHDADSLDGGMRESERVAHFVLNQIREIVSITISVEVDKDTSDLGTQLGGPTPVSAPAKTFARRSFGSDPIFPAFKRDPARLATLLIDVTRDNATGIGNACKLRYSPGRNVCDLTDMTRRQVRREDEHVRRRGRQPPQDALIYWISARCARAVVVVERELPPERIIVRRRWRRRRHHDLHR